MNDRQRGSEQDKGKDRDGRAPVCFNCQRPGHFKRDCRAKRRSSFSQNQDRGFKPQKGFNFRNKFKGQGQGKQFRPRDQGKRPGQRGDQGNGQGKWRGGKQGFRGRRNDQFTELADSFKKLASVLSPNEPQQQAQAQQHFVPQQYVPQGNGYAEQSHQQKYSLNN